MRLGLDRIREELDREHRDRCVACHLLIFLTTKFDSSITSLLCYLSTHENNTYNDNDFGLITCCRIATQSNFTLASLKLNCCVPKECAKP